MNLKLTRPSATPIQQELTITGSKSESNRLLLLQALYPGLRIHNLSDSDDARVMQKGLRSEADTVDIHHAGTAMRFLTAYFASRPGREVVLTGSSRMKQRPIRILVEALRALGADIDYLETPGCPPLRIRGRALKGSRVTLPADVSSQYITALLLVAPSLENGLEITLEGRITSLPYIRMTLGLLGRVGIPSRFEGQTLRVGHIPAVKTPLDCTVESDWSSASYYFSLLALAPAGSWMGLRAYRQDSLQGDSVLPRIYDALGVRTSFDGDRMVLEQAGTPAIDFLELDLIRTPDLAQTIVVSCFGLGMGCDLSGLHTLKIKETDRLLALETELGKLGAQIAVTDRSLRLEPGGAMVPMQRITTYNDHRMAMAFAPLALLEPLIIEDAGVVSKSYPSFWEDFKSLNFLAEQM